MRKLKLIFAALMALALIVTGVTLVASAEEQYTSVGTFEDLQAAIALGESVKLIADITAPASAITVDKTLTVDLNGHTIKDGSASIFVLRNDEATESVVLTITNSSDTQSTLSSNGHCLSLFASSKENVEHTLVIDGSKGGIVLHRPSTYAAGKFAIALKIPDVSTSCSRIKFTGNVDLKLDKTTGSGSPMIAYEAATADANSTQAKFIVEFDKANFTVQKTTAITNYSGPGKGKDAYTPLYWITTNVDFIINDSTLDLYYAPIFRSTSLPRTVTLTTNNSSIKNYGEATTASTVANDFNCKLSLFHYGNTSYGGNLTINCTNTDFNMGSYLASNTNGKVNCDFKFTDCDFVLLDESEGGVPTGAIKDLYTQLFSAPQKCIIDGGYIDGYVRFASNAAANKWDATAETGVLVKGDVKFDADTYPLYKAQTWPVYTLEGDWYYIGAIDPMTHKLVPGPAYALGKTNPVVYNKLAFNLTIVDADTDTNNSKTENLAFTTADGRYGAFETVTKGDNTYFRYHYNDGGALPTDYTCAYLWRTYNSGYRSNVQDGMLTGDFDYWTFDYDISSSGNGFAPHRFNLYNFAGIQYTETVTVATGEVERQFLANTQTINRGFNNITLSQDGTISLTYTDESGLCQHTETAKLDTTAGVWSHVTLVLSVKDNATYVFVNGVKEIEFKHPETYPVLGIQSATDWTDEGETKSRVVTTTAFQQFKFENFGKPNVDETKITDTRDVYYDNFVMQAYRGNYDIGNALESGNIFDSEDAIYAPTYQMPAGQTPVANLNGIDFFGVNNLQAYLEREQAKDPENTGMFDDAEIELLADAYGFVVDYALYVITNGNEFTYFSDKYFGEVDDDMVSFVEAEPEQFVTVEWKSGDAVVKSGEYIIGTTIPAGFIENNDAESNGYYVVAGYSYDAYTVLEDNNSVECVECYAPDLQNVKYNVSTQSFFYFYVYVPVPDEELNVVITNNVSIVEINGVPHYQIKFNNAVAANSIKPIKCTVTYTVNGVKLSQTFSFKLADYFKQVLADENQSEEAVALIVSAVNYCNEMTKLANDGQGNAEYEAILTEKANVIPALDEKVLEEQQAAIKAPDASFTEYFTGATIYYSDSNPRWALVAKEDVEIDPAALTFSNALGAPTAVEDTQLLVANYAFTPKVWDIDDTVTITYTVDENTAVSCEYNLASYILGVEGQDGNADFARALYQFCLASEAYTGNGN